MQHSGTSSSSSSSFAAFEPASGAPTEPLSGVASTPHETGRGASLSTRRTAGSADAGCRETGPPPGDGATATCIAGTPTLLPTRSSERGSEAQPTTSQQDRLINGRLIVPRHIRIDQPLLEATSGSTECPIFCMCSIKLLWRGTGQSTLLVSEGRYDFLTSEVPFTSTLKSRRRVFQEPVPPGSPRPTATAHERIASGEASGGPSSAAGGLPMWPPVQRTAD